MLSSISCAPKSCDPYLSVRSRGDIFSRRYKVPVEPNYRQIEKQILDDVLGPKVYDPRIRPAGQNSTGRGDIQNKVLTTVRPKYVKMNCNGGSCDL